ncbi:transglutaminase domain-containing protein [Porphyromonas pogonae]|uniref:transglutaminase domain-containing protein n=1 Tax=Porphyromonas pogonae TaxID=867595 RepID=UPI002E79A892|nr:transglutaminase domain-containing protein [Porphyromonas pogonae]
MKKYLFILGLLSVVSCQKEELKSSEEPSVNKNNETTNTEVNKEESKVPDTTPGIVLTRKDSIFRKLVNGCLRREPECDVSNFNIVRTKPDGADGEYKSLYDEFVSTYPFLFHVLSDGSVSIFYKLDKPSEVRSYKFDYMIHPNDIGEWAPRVIEGMREYYESLQEGMSEEEIAYTLYEQITKKVIYKETDHPFDALGGLVLGQAVCQGYAMAYRMLMKCIGMDVECAKGLHYGVKHMWNRIKIDNEWYNCDVTWDDNKSKNKINSDCLGDFFLTSDNTFYEKLHHPRISTDDVVAPAVSKKFESENYFFRNAAKQSEAVYRDGYWYYLSWKDKDVCVYKSKFDGTDKSVLRRLTRSSSDGILWKRAAFGAERIYFIDKVNSKDYICSIKYDGSDFKKTRSVTYYDLLEDLVKLKEDNDKPQRGRVGTIALRCEVAIAKMKDAYYHSKEDLFVPENATRVRLLEIIKRAESHLKNNPRDQSMSEKIYNELHATLAASNMPLTGK